MTSLQRAQAKVEELKKVTEELDGVVKPVITALESAIKALEEKAENGNKAIKATVKPYLKRLQSLKDKAVL